MSDSNASRRKLFMHSAHEKIGVSAGVAALRACDLSRFIDAEQVDRSVHVRLVAGSPASGREELAAAIDAYLTNRFNMVCTRARCDTADDLLDVADLDDVDCLLLLAGELTVVGGRISSLIFENHAELAGAVFGGAAAGDQREAVDVEIAQGAEEHPLLAGIEPFHAHLGCDAPCDIAADGRVLLVGASAGSRRPVAWIREHRGARVFRTSIGCPSDVRNFRFLRLLANAVGWAAGRHSSRESGR